MGSHQFPNMGMGLRLAAFGRWSSAIKKIAPPPFFTQLLPERLFSIWRTQRARRGKACSTQPGYFMRSVPFTFSLSLTNRFIKASKTCSLTFISSECSKFWTFPITKFEFGAQNSPSNCASSNRNLGSGRPCFVINLKPSSHHLPRLALLFAGGVILVYLM